MTLTPAVATVLAVVLVACSVLVLAAMARGVLVPRRLLPVGKPPRRQSRWRARRPPATDRDLANWSEHAASEVRAGASLPRAIERAAADVPVAGAELAPVVEGLRRGQSLGAALEALDTDPSRPVAVVVPVLRACAELGGAAGPPLERVAATLHARADAAAERWAHSAQARLSARVLSVLPVGVLVLLAAGEPSIRTAALTPAGLACLVAGGLLNVGGWCWMRHVIEGAA